MADRLRQLYHRYDWCEYFQLKIEFTGCSAGFFYGKLELYTLAS